MRDDICTIPISEIFEEKDGCPICRMYKIIEERVTEYILGDAMMESDIRMLTNELGFCRRHYDFMMSKRGRLQLALMLETHLKTVGDSVFKKSVFGTGAEKMANKSKSSVDSCFICNKTEQTAMRLIDTLFLTYENEKDFRDLFNSQPRFCLPHFSLLMSGIQKKKNLKYKKDFEKNVIRITSEYLDSLCLDVSKYCSMYDYRGAASGNADWGNSKDSIERSADFLTGRYPK